MAVSNFEVGDLQGQIEEINAHLVQVRTKTSGSKTVGADSYATWTTQYDYIGPDTISGFSVVSAFATTNHDRIELGVNKVSDTQWNVNAHNSHTASQDCTVTICYVYVKNAQ